MSLKMRSLLAVPAVRQEFFAKAAASATDALFLDLEDSVPPSQKLAARSHAAQALHEVDWGDKRVLVRTNIPKLALIASSIPRGDSTERVASSAMDRLLDELSSRYADRIIVIDAPPLLLTNESRILATLAGQVVMVVEAGRTTRRAVTEAFAAVEQCPVVMSVLNKRSQAMRGYGYGYAYGYGY